MQLRPISFVIGLSVFLSLAPGARAEAFGSGDSTSTKDTSSMAGKLLRPKFEKWGFVYLPRAYYSSETSFGLGGQIEKPFYVKPDSSMSGGFRFKGRVTFKGQSMGELRLRLRMGAHTVNTRFWMSTIPLRFYGIGPNTPESNKEVYRPQNTLYYLEVMHDALPHLNVGIRAEVENFQLVERKTGGLLQDDGVPGVHRSTAAGVGILLEWDTRDRRYSPHSGSFHQAFVLGFADHVTEGSLLKLEHDFTVYNVDLRRYFSLGGGYVLAAQAFLYGTDGNTPFWRFAALGGREHSRGYRKARYVDRVMVSSQVELRVPLRDRITAAAFVGAGAVGPALNTIQTKYTHPTFGIGLRYRVKPPHGVNARLDVAAGQNTVRVNVSLDEAF